MTAPEIAAWVASAISLVSVYLYGNKHIAAPILGIIVFVPWMVVAVAGPVILWGLVPANFFYLAIHIRNLVKFRREGAQ